jgi:hypothetical protein
VHAQAAGGEQALVQGNEKARRISGGHDGHVQVRLFRAGRGRRTSAARRQWDEDDRQHHCG